MTSDDRRHFVEPRSYVGNRHRPLRGEQKTRVLRLMPDLGLDLSTDAPEPLSALFPGSTEQVWLEIGFGGGEHLAARLHTEPKRGTIGCEPYEAGLAKLLGVLGSSSQERVKLYNGDARFVLDWLPASSLDGIELLYPDPWPKTRHHKRRFISAANLGRLARVLKPGSLFRFATDIADYADWGLRLVRRHPEFFWTASGKADWQQPFPDWPGTRYEAKALREGRRPHYLTFQRR